MAYLFDPTAVVPVHVPVTDTYVELLILMKILLGRALRGDLKRVAYIVHRHDFPDGYFLGS